MTRVPLFGVFILALCLVACVCAHADDTVTKDTAKAAAVTAEESAKKAVKKATEEKGKADTLLTNINKYKEEADAAQKEAETAAKTNKEAAATAEKAKKASEGLVKLRDDTSTGVQSIVDTLKELHTKATGFETEAKTLLESVEKNTNYAEIKQKAGELETNVKDLDTKIEAEKGKITTVQGGVDEIKKALKPETTDASNAPGQREDTVPRKTEDPKKTGATQDIENVIPQGTTGSPVSGDSAMTVPVPLLMALIACAALQ